MAPRPREGAIREAEKENDAQDWAPYKKQQGGRMGQISTQKEEDHSDGSSMGHAAGRMGNKAGNPPTATILQKRDAIQLEIARQHRKTQTQTKKPHHILIIQEWRKVSDHLKEYKHMTIYARRPITNLEKPKKKCQTLRKTRRPRKTIQEYTDWDNGKHPI